MHLFLGIWRAAPLVSGTYPVVCGGVTSLGRKRGAACSARFRETLTPRSLETIGPKHIIIVFKGLSRGSKDRCILDTRNSSGQQGHVGERNTLRPDEKCA